MNKRESYRWSSIICEPNGGEFSPSEFSLSDVSSSGEGIPDPDRMISSFSVWIDSFIFIFRCGWGRGWTWHDWSKVSVIYKIEIGEEAKWKLWKWRKKLYGSKEWDSGYMYCGLVYHVFSTFSSFSHAYNFPFLYIINTLVREK